MNYCPNCGMKLIEDLVENKIIKKCHCGYIDWNNWVYVATVVVCFNEKQEFLMVKLKENGRSVVTFPGGFRDLNETIEEAAKREFFEETGYKIKDLKLYKVYNKDSIRLVWIAYSATLGEGEFVENSETDGIIFYSKNNPPKEEDLRGSLTLNLLSDILTDF